MTLEDTAKIHKAQTPETAQELFRLLQQNVGEVIDLLRHQQEVMRQRGMSLPSGALDGLRKTRLRLDGLAGTLMGGQIKLRQLRELARTTALINSSQDASDVLNQVMDTVILLTGAERGYIVLRNPDTGEMEFRVARGLDNEQLGESDFIVSSTIVNRVADTGEPVLTHNALSDPRYQGQESIVGFALRSILAVPLSVQGQVIGVVYCDNRIRAGLFKDHELNLLRAFADQAAVAIQNARLFEATRAQLAEVTAIRDMMDNIFTSIASGLITLNRDNIITALNTAAARITGLTNDALGTPLQQALPSLDGLALFDTCLLRVREQGSQELVEVEPVLDEGGRRYWNVIMSPLRDAEGNAEGVVLVLDDMTEVRQREAQLAEARRYLPPALIDNIRTLDIANVGGQEREISAIFADVRGFTTFSENLQPEALMEVINKYLSAASDAIVLYEGVVDKYMGDAVTGLFNTQLNPQDDHALRAVHAALSMVYDVRAQHEVLPEAERLFYGIGIHTGMAVMGSVGSPERREFTAIGDALEMSKLLQENAEKGEIIVSEATYLQVKDYFECEAMRPRKTKGRTDFMVMYRVVGRRKGVASPLIAF